MLTDKMPIGTGQLGTAGGIGGVAPGSSPASNRPEGASDKSSFENLLGNKISGEMPQIDKVTPPKVDGLKFSQHAVERMASRGISFKPEEMAKLNDAVDRAAKKGSKESLVLMGENALIVSVKNRTVVTAMDRDAMKENVFTNIDSTVIL